MAETVQEGIRYALDGNGNLAPVIFPDGSGIIATAWFVPTAGAYGAADMIDVAKRFSFSFGNGAAAPSDAMIRILTSIIRIDETALIANETSYSLPLYSAKPPVIQNDNDAWALASADLPFYQGTLALGTPVDAGAACFIKTQLSDQQDFRLSQSSLWGELVGAGTPTLTAIGRQVTLIGVVL